MPINTKVISQLAKSTVDKKTTKKETITRGKLVLDNDGNCYVSLLEESNEFLIPATITTNIDFNQPVTVLIKNHTATVLGNAIEPTKNEDDDIINSTIGNHFHTWESVVGLDKQLENKAAKDHDHNDKYAAKEHTHDYSSVYAEKNHNHDDKYLTNDSLKDYATKTYAANAASDAASKAASNAVSELTERLTSEDQNERLIVAQSNKATQDGNGNVIANTYATKKELEEIDITDHNHDDTYAPINHKHDNDYAAKEHEHSQYLTEHQSLENYATKSYADSAASGAVDALTERLTSEDQNERLMVAHAEQAESSMYAFKASRDNDGNIITDTYATKKELEEMDIKEHNHDDKYVAKESGKGLSTNNYSDSDKFKLESLYIPITCTGGPGNYELNVALKEYYTLQSIYMFEATKDPMYFAVNGNPYNIIYIKLASSDSTGDKYNFKWWNFTTNTYKTNQTGSYLKPDYIDNPNNRPPDVQIVESKIYNLDNYLPLSGGTLTGDLYMNNKAIYNATLYGKVNGTASGATKATKDSDGNVITDTYATKDEINNKIDSNGFKTESIENGELNRLTVTDCDGDTATILEIDVNSHMEFGDENTDLYLRGYQERPYYQSHDGDDSKELALLEDVCVVTITDLRSQS